MLQEYTPIGPVAWRQGWLHTEGVAPNLDWGSETYWKKGPYTFTNRSRVELNPGGGDRGHLSDLLALRHFSSILPFYSSHSNLTHKAHNQCS